MHLTQKTPRSFSFKISIHVFFSEKIYHWNNDRPKWNFYRWRSLFVKAQCHMIGNAACHQINASWTSIPTHLLVPIMMQHWFRNSRVLTTQLRQIFKRKYICRASVTYHIMSVTPRINRITNSWFITSTNIK